jgi:hypothetical protein
MDGVHVLRKRKNTRLWYRQMPVLPQRTIKPADDTADSDGDQSNDEAWEKLFAELGDEALEQSTVADVMVPLADVDVLILPTAAVDMEVPTSAPTVPPATVKEKRAAPAAASESDDWRTVPNAAPSILLSATEVLDARTPGPVLHPGVRYRITGIQNGIVGLDVIDPTGEEGDSGLGFCSTVDLICIDRRFAGYQPGRAFDPGVPFRSRVTRLTGSLSRGTNSLRGMASNSSRLS